jgi:hypothetical protein
VRVTEIESSGHVVLGCERCGERLVLIGLERDWTSDGRTAFACGGCGGELTFADRLGEDEGTNL